MKKLLFLLSVSPLFLLAQPFTFQSKNTAKPIEFTLGWHNSGRGAYVLYKGKTEPITLQIRSFKTDTTQRADHQPDEQQYVWDEVYKGQVTGTYGLTMMAHNIYDVFYIRKSDNKRFDFDFMEEKALDFDGEKMALLHGVQLHYNITYNNTFQVKYPGKNASFLLTALPDGEAYRYENIADYNFDGYNDIAFSVPDAGYGVFRYFDIFLYNPVTKTFNPLLLPAHETLQCQQFCNVVIDAKHKQLSSSCRGGAKWHTDLFSFDKKGGIIYLKSTEQSGTHVGGQ